MGADLSSESEFPGEPVERAESREALSIQPGKGSLSEEVTLISASEISRALFSANQEADTIAKAYYCLICMNTVSDVKGFTLPCGHLFCRSCLESFLIAKILEADVKISCFHPTSLTTDPNPNTLFADNDQSQSRSSISFSGSDEVKSEDERSLESPYRVCGNEIPDNIIQKVLRDPAMYDKYKRFRFMKDHPNSRECPKCGFFNINGSESNLLIKCENSRCGFEFCFLHSDAHPNETCEQYEKRTETVNKESLDLIANTTKKCPGCGVSIRKEGGCNHMKCPHCSQSFCWLCLTKIEDTVLPAHFQWWNATGTCSNLQMDEAEEPTAATRHIASLLMVVQMIVLGPFVLVSTLATILCCGAFVHPNQFREVSVCVFRPVP